MPTPKMTEEEQAAYDKALKMIEACRQKGKEGKVLTLSKLGLTRLPREIGQLTALTELHLNNNQLTSLPPQISKLTALTTLRLFDNQLTKLPPQIGQLSGLTELWVHGNQLSSLPPEIGQLSKLIALRLHDNLLTYLPPEIGLLRSLTRLWVAHNLLGSLSPEIGKLAALTELGLERNGLNSLPIEIGTLDHLERLWLHDNPALGLPPVVLGPTFRDAHDKGLPPASPKAILDYYFAHRPTTPVAPLPSPPVKAEGISSSPSDPEVGLPPTSAPAEESYLIPGTDQTDGRAMQDQASSTDSMGRAGMISALGEFIASEQSLPPLSITIEAPWGEGKSSALVQLRDYLVKHHAGRTVWFNPWRYTEAEALWSGFLAEFTEQMQKGKGLWERFKVQHRYLKEIYGDWILLKCIGGIMLFPVAAFALRGWLTSRLPSTQDGWVNWVLNLGTYLAAWGPWMFIALKLWFAFRKPVRTLVGEMKSYLKKPDYAARRGSSERLHDEFRTWLKACLRPNERVYVFVDDLDRCAGPRAAELLEWLQLMMSSSGGGKPFPVVVIAGLDREKVAAGVATRHSDVLPILAPAETVQAKAEAAIIWGYEYLEKFIDLPVRLPPGSPKVLETYLKNLAPGAFEAEKQRDDRQREIATQIRAERRARLSGVLRPHDLYEPIRQPPTQVDEPGTSSVSDAGLEDARIPGLLRAAGVLLNHSPRRLKHFLNLLRLRWAVRKKIGKDRMTLELTARVVLMETARPTLFRALADSPSVRHAVFEQRDEESPGVFRDDGHWKALPPDQMFEADKRWLTRHGMEVLVNDWDEILSQSPYPPEEPDDDLGLTRTALDALIDCTPYQ